VFKFEDLSWNENALSEELTAKRASDEVRRDIKATLERIRRDMEHARKDLTSASKTVVDSTSKFVKETSPKVSATIDETIERTSETFKRTMTRIDSETKPQQVKLLKAYRSFLSRQIDVIEKRLERLKK
jgi:gas vesicle protein